MFYNAVIITFYQKQKTLEEHLFSGQLVTQLIQLVTQVLYLVLPNSEVEGRHTIRYTLLQVHYRQDCLQLFHIPCRHGHVQTQGNILSG